LEEIISRGENWRQRERAQTLVLLADGLSLLEAAQQVGKPSTINYIRQAEKCDSATI
jgi:hypothetical protein